jgi:enoyl-CoA hydratase
VALDELRDTALELAETIAMNDRLSVEITKRAINRSLEIGGMRKALLDAFEADIAIETAESDEAKKFYEVLHKEGIKSAIEWRREHIKKLSND